jgi:hypothetical protein
MKWSICSVALACAACVAGCQARDDTAPSPRASDSPGLSQLPIADPPLDRETLLLAVMRAASAAALGEENGSVQQALDGKRFELRLRFGCPGEELAGAYGRRWTHDQDGRIVRIRIGPEIEGDTPLVDDLAGPDIEAVEGFWIHRPWQLKAGCPAPPAASSAEGDAQASAPSPTEPTADTANEAAPSLGIAQFFRETDARTHRRGSRAYEAAENLSEGEAPSRTGYDLIVHGRLQSLPDGRVIACRAAGMQRPACVISARFEEVSLERADTGKLLAEWPRG